MTYAKLLQNRRSQNVPSVRETPFLTEQPGFASLREPLMGDLLRWFAALDRLNDQPFMPEGLEQVATPE